MTKHTIVALDLSIPLPPLGFEHELIKHDKTSPEELPERMKDATIVLTSAVRITRAAIENAPHLKLINCNGCVTFDSSCTMHIGLVLRRVIEQTQLKQPRLETF